MPLLSVCDVKCGVSCSYKLVKIIQVSWSIQECPWGEIEAQDTIVRGKLAPHVALPGVQLSSYIKRTCIFCGAPFGTQFMSLLWQSSTHTVRRHSWCYCILQVVPSWVHTINLNTASYLHLQDQYYWDRDVRDTIYFILHHVAVPKILELGTC